MMLGGVGLAATACFGLAWLAQRSGRVGHVVVAGVTALMLFELWPSYWTQGVIPATPAFYETMAQEDGNFAVLDLPVAWGPHDVVGGTPEMMATYQMFQMTHRKPIAYGYLSHIYQENPESIVQRLAYGSLRLEGTTLVEPDLLLDGAPAAAFDASDQQQLAADGFRYVVWHKDLLARLQGPSPDDVTPAFLAAAFPSTAPRYEDASLAAYRIGDPPAPGAAPAGPTLRYGAGWSPPDGSGRRGDEAAALELTGMAGGPAVLRIQTPGGAPAPAPVSRGSSGTTLTVTTPAGSTPFTVASGQLVEVPIRLAPGTQQVTIALDEAARVGGATSFTIASIDLHTTR